MQLWTRQLLISLKYLHKHELIHADLKPDNVVVNSKYNVVKVPSYCSFSSSASQSLGVGVSGFESVFGAAL